MVEVQIKSRQRGFFEFRRKILQEDRFYFVKDDFYEKFPDCGLMANGIADENGQHARPCFYAKQIENFFWLIPLSSKVEKYQRLYEEKISKYSTYDGIKFGYVNGKKRAFLIQNIFPITEEFIDKIYNQIVNSAGNVYRQSKQKVRVQIFPLLGKRFINGRGSN